MEISKILNSFFISKQIITRVEGKPTGEQGEFMYYASARGLICRIYTELGEIYTYAIFSMNGIIIERMKKLK